MLYLIGLGLNEKSISMQGLDSIKKCNKVYLENYTVDFPYEKENLDRIISKKTIPVERDFIESFKILNEAKKMDVALLVYGSPLSATTHISLIQEAKSKKIKVEIIYNASVLDAVAETGLQLYKFGKITSIPAWKKNYEPDSFVEVIEENQSINAHTLILVDIGLEFQEALNHLELSLKKRKKDLKEIIVCSCLGTKNQKILYGILTSLKKQKIRKPYCFIVPGKLHFFEKEILKS